MSKNYKEISNQVAVIKTKDKTLSFYANLTPAPIYRYGELIDGKIKILLNDFSNGKGDNANFSKYNLDIPAFRYLFEKVKMGYLPNPYYGKKIITDHAVESGRYKGLYLTNHITIQYTPFTENHEIMRNPWKIFIENGYADANKYPNGSASEKPGTFQKENFGMISLSDIDMYGCFSKINDYLSCYIDIIGKQLIPKGLKLLEEKMERGGYRNLYPQEFNKDYNSNDPAYADYYAQMAAQMSNGSYTQASQSSGSPRNGQAPQNTFGQPQTAGQNLPANSYQNAGSQPQMQQQNQAGTYQAPVAQPQMQQPAAQPQAAQSPKTVQTDQPNSPYHKMKILVMSDFQALEGESVAMCMINGKKYAVYFNQVNDSLINAKAKNLPISVILYQDNNRKLRFYDLAS